MYHGKLKPTRSIREKMKIFEPQDVDESDEHLNNESNNTMISQNITRDSDGLIVPKKLVNPCLQSTDRQNLHRELLFNQKIGKTVLNQKTELERALEKQKQRHVAAQNEMNKDCSSTLQGELGKVIMERAQKLETKTKDQQNNCSNSEYMNDEYLKARAKLRGCDSNKYI